MQDRMERALELGLLLSLGFVFSFASQVAAPSVGGISVLWPSAALFLLAFLRAEQSSLPVVALLVFSTELVAFALAGASLAAASTSAAMDAGAIYGVALLARNMGSMQKRADQPATIVLRAIVMLLVVTVFAFLMGIAQAGFSRTARDAGLAWMAGRGFAVAVLMPLLLLIGSLVSRWRDRPRRVPRPDALVALAILVLLSVLIFAQSKFPLLFLMVLLATTAAFSFKEAGAVAAMIVTIVIGGASTALGYGPMQLMPGGVAEHLMMFQFFAGTMFIATISIAVRMEERALLFSRVRSSESRFRQLVDRSIDVIFETDARGCWTFLNPSWEALTGRPVAWSIGTSFVEWIDEGQRASVLAEQRRLWAGEIEEARVELAFWHRDGTRRCAWIRCRLMVDEAGRPCGTWGTIHDITSRKAVEAAEAAATARILAMANTDDLTGIANRRHFLACLQDEVDRCRRNGSRFLLLMFDIDHFKQVNDTHGHATGDAVLKAVAAITVDVVRSTDTVARIGGEEFAILMPDTQMDDGRAVASRLLRALAGHELHGASGPVRVTVSIGLAQWTGSTSAEELMRAADKALYQAKHEGRNRLAAAA